MKMFFAAAAIVCMAFSAFAGEVAVDPANPSYHNARYGFSVEWTAGQYSVAESDNGDGITVRDGKGMEMLVWGSLEQDVFGLTREQFFSRVSKSGASYKKVNEKQGWYVVSGVEDSRIYYVKSYYTDDAVITMRITCPQDQKKNYDGFVSRASRSFRPQR